MDVDLAYGNEGLRIEVPDGSTIVNGQAMDAFADETREVEEALQAPVAGRPLTELVQPGMSVAVVFPDITRPMPNQTVLPPLLSTLMASGIRSDEIELICATGSHRPASRDELVELLGPAIVSQFRVRNHSSNIDAHRLVGTVHNAPVWIDRGYLDADLKITTGFVEPHFFAGMSGGPKAVCPGLAALETILEAHHPRRIADPKATWLQLDGNPVHDFIRAATSLAMPDFSIDVVIDEHRRLVRIFAGAPTEAHREACQFVRRSAVQEVAGRFDVVVSTNGGYPLDRNLYQAVKGLSAAERVVKRGGTIILAAECRDGIPPEGAFGTILQQSRSADDLIDPEQPPKLDAWQTQILGRVLRHAHVALHSTFLSDEDIRNAYLEPTTDVTRRVAMAVTEHGNQSRVCVLPRGPLTVAVPVNTR